MININGETFFKESGELDWLGVISEDISRPGYDGLYTREIGLRADRSTIVIMKDYNSSTIANAAFSVIKGLESSTVQVIDGYGVEPIVYPYVFVHKVKKLSQFQTGAISGLIRNSTVSYNATILRIELTLQVNG